MKTESWDKYLERHDGELPAGETPAIVTESYADFVKRAPEPPAEPDAAEGAEAEAAAAAEAEAQAQAEAEAAAAAEEKSAEEPKETPKPQGGGRKKNTSA